MEDEVDLYRQRANISHTHTMKASTHRHTRTGCAEEHLQEGAKNKPRMCADARYTHKASVPTSTHHRPPPSCIVLQCVQSWCTDSGEVEPPTPEWTAVSTCAEKCPTRQAPTHADADARTVSVDMCRVRRRDCGTGPRPSLWRKPERTQSLFFFWVVRPPIPLTSSLVRATLAPK